MTSTSSGGSLRSGCQPLVSTVLMQVLAWGLRACRNFRPVPNRGRANGEGSQWRIAIRGEMQSSLEEGCAQTGVPGHCHAWLRLPPLARLLLLATPRLCCWHHAAAMPCSRAASCGVNAAHACSGIKQELGSRQRKTTKCQQSTSEQTQEVGRRRQKKRELCFMPRLAPAASSLASPLRAKFTSTGTDQPDRRRQPGPLRRRQQVQRGEAGMLLERKQAHHATVSGNLASSLLMPSRAGS